jgi:nitrogen fixation protein NifB
MIERAGLSGRAAGTLAPFRIGITAQPGCAATGAGGRAGCGSALGPQDMPSAVWEKVKTHPCYSEEAHHYYARMHLAVAPACNIQCNYCNRKYDCCNESRPGVVSRKLTPEQAVTRALAVAAATPQLTVLGIAGPGDALANPERTFGTLRMLRERALDIRPCLSTNGLALPEHVDEIVGLGIDHVTITVNMVDAEVGERIYAWIYYGGKRIRGREAARILGERQLRGLEMLAARGVLVKVNSVLIPGVNDRHLVEVNKAVKARGAFLHNIMPLISEPEHGTAFGLSGQRGPSARELREVQEACLGGANLMRHCRQCRADAVGLLGEDLGGRLARGRTDSVRQAYDFERRRAYQRQVEAERQIRRAAGFAAAARARGGPDLELLAAVATRGGGRINQHFGHAAEFQIYEIAARAGNVSTAFVGHRRVDLYCRGGYGEDERLASIIEAINDCHAVLVAKIGACPREGLRGAGIEAVDGYAHAFIEAGLLDWFDGYRARLARGESVHRPRGDARIRQGAYLAA